ncbi:hypothetical protein Trydic_g18742 [Trypoxylus dichotomus]
MRTLLVTLIVSINIDIYICQREGEICENRKGEKGVCRLYLNCPYSISDVGPKGEIQGCNIEPLPLLCCQKSKPYTPFDENSLRLRKCREFHPNRTIIPPDAFLGGRDSIAKENPHMAVLGYGKPDDIQWQCGGSLISQEFVLTAAHCLYSRLGELKFVRLGELDLASTTDDADPQDFLVKRTYRHPSYNGVAKYHDIALVQLHQPAKLTAYVKPICLPITENITYMIPKAMGWGLTSLDACRKIYGTSFEFREGILDKLQLCANGGDIISDTCPGDSGGPLEIRNDQYEFSSFPEIVGITSFGKGCGLAAGVYTRVSPYVPWIEKIVWPNL